MNPESKPTLESRTTGIRLKALLLELFDLISYFPLNLIYVAYNDNTRKK